MMTSIPLYAVCWKQEDGTHFLPNHAFHTLKEAKGYLADFTIAGKQTWKKHDSHGNWWEGQRVSIVEIQLLETIGKREAK